MKTLMLATQSCAALATAVLLAASASSAMAEDGSSQQGWQEVLLLPPDSNGRTDELFTDPRQYGPDPEPAWKRHQRNIDVDNYLDWETGTNDWMKSVRKSGHMPNPLAGEGLPEVDTFGSNPSASSSPWPSDLGVPARPGRTYGLNQASQSYGGYNSIDRFGDFTPFPQTQTFVGTPYEPEPEHNVAPPAEKQVDWGALFGGIADTAQDLTRSN